MVLNSSASDNEQTRLIRGRSLIYALHTGKPQKGGAK